MNSVKKNEDGTIPFMAENMTAKQLIQYQSIKNNQKPSSEIELKLLFPKLVDPNYKSIENEINCIESVELVGDTVRVTYKSGDKGEVKKSDFLTQYNNKVKDFKSSKPLLTAVIENDQTVITLLKKAYGASNITYDQNGFKVTKEGFLTSEEIVPYGEDILNEAIQKNSPAIMLMISQLIKKYSLDPNDYSAGIDQKYLEAFRLEKGLEIQVIKGDDETFSIKLKRGKNSDLIVRSGLSLDDCLEVLKNTVNEPLIDRYSLRQYSNKSEQIVNNKIVPLMTYFDSKIIPTNSTSFYEYQRALMILRADSITLKGNNLEIKYPGRDQPEIITLDNFKGKIISYYFKHDLEPQDWKEKLKIMLGVDDEELTNVELFLRKRQDYEGFDGIVVKKIYIETRIPTLNLLNKSNRLKWLRGKKLPNR